MIQGAKPDPIDGALFDGPTRPLGDRRVRRDFILHHARKVRAWYDRHGRYLPANPPPYINRERLWNAGALLATGRPSDRVLANRIIVGTRIDDNRFLSFAAADLLLGQPESLTAPARRHLLDVLRRHVVNMMEHRFGTPGLNNIGALTTYAILASAELLDGYDWSHPFGGSPEMYTRGRLQQVGLNALYAMAYCAEHEPVMREWNSSSYCVLTLHALAAVVEWIPDVEARQVAARIEARVWRQILRAYHPGLDVLCGPYSRSYERDVGQRDTNLHLLLTYLGLRRERSLTGRIYPRGRAAAGEPLQWSEVAWYTNCRYHVPADALDELKKRRYPSVERHAIRWEPFGVISRTARPSADHVPGLCPAGYFPAQGEAFPGGKGTVWRFLHKNWAVGWRSADTMPNSSFPLHLHYAGRDGGRPRGVTRSLVAGILVCRELPANLAWPFSHDGAVEVRGKDRYFRFTGQPHAGMRHFPIGEVSINCFLTTGDRWPDEIRLGSERFTGTTLERITRAIRLRVRDGGFEYDLGYRFSRPVPVRLAMERDKLRFAAFFREGVAQAARSSVPRLPLWEGWLRLRRT